MNNEHQTRVEHFAALKSKYKATDYENSSPASLLYLILRKADLGIEIIERERNWLIEHKLSETLEAIRKEHTQREKELRKLEREFYKLTSKYKALELPDSWQSTPLYFILSRLESENKLTNSEIQWLKSYGYTETIEFAQ
ncbi:hypothetical protein MC7420_464 [Coleofasciculus chthonoplastes PCC 7420]|uniref:Uncharacterized protein n=1 Tax=Coleofasciculus chthonoplastes PCC 7420 TaxID=118168 RepID=B4VL49_9CYAN|nr:hypothetical protein [Coleofasciculus chthonoplastes]EDX77327.1 hypothetical protein MC7420_464 [Coleofasciculus chthonoplastes PCC 7420]